MPNPLPSVLVSYARILLHRRAGFATDSVLPSLTHEAIGLRCDPRQLKRYAEVCGLPASDQVPLLFPQVLAMPLHMRLIGDRRIPIKALGLVHIRNHVQRYRHLPAGVAFDLRCRLLGQRRTDKGLEIDLGSELWCSGVLCWQALTTYLRQGRFLLEGQFPEELPKDRQWSPLAKADEQIEWAVPDRAGLQFAAISGDFNPIHVSDWAARRFGFPQAIAHGMWVLGRSLAERPLPEQVRLDVRFSSPVLLGSTLMQQVQELAGCTLWQLLSAEGEGRVLMHARLREGVIAPLFCTDR